ncbi:DUF1302 domain-containing protein [Zavarzinia compransoris]|uniref:DUF1302 domain-containing protein n=1 Tax=Zavarzinia marina TaxID=2911065 RepID=UPI001F3E91F8|nr:DUF1302 family protein [Zavarzinia marina]MCF4166490.1 DUF1302 domain-containing protein [Zavarzinia marina]
MAAKFRGPAAYGAGAVLLMATSAAAYDFEIGDEVTGSVITTLAVGAQMRMADRDPRNVGYYNGGVYTPADADDGNLNFDKYDIVSQITSVRSELRLRWRDWFATVSGEAFVDSVALDNHLAENGPAERPYRGRYSPSAQDAAAWDAQFREYYVGTNVDLFDNNLSIKIGNQILNWGEALFTLNGISVINPIDVNKILTPGAELKDALIPVPLIKLGYELMDGPSFEVFYQFDFEPLLLPVCGSFLAFNDNVCQGAKGTSVFTDYGDTRSYTVGRDDAADYDNPPPPWGTGPQALSTSIPLHQIDDPDGGDWGASIRYFSPDLNNTEFQFYYVNYRSRLPSIYFQAPETYAAGTGQADLTTAAPGALGSAVALLGLEDQQALTSLVQGLVPGVQFGGDLVSDLIGAPVGGALSALIQPPLGTLPRSTVFENMDDSAFYQYYPDDIQMLGFAFSTTENWSGIAINGEISWKHDVPVLMSAPAFFAKAINQMGGIPIDQGAYGANLPIGPASIGGQQITPEPIYVKNFGIAPIADGPAGETFDDQYGPGRVIRADRRHDVWQAALRLTKIFGGTDLPSMLTGATSVIALVEFGALHVDLEKGYPYGAYGQNGFSEFYSRSLGFGGAVQISPPEPVTALGDPFWETGKTPTQWSGGVQGLFILDYPDLIPGVKLTPSVAFQTGLFGITPAPLPGFTKGMTSLLFGVRADFTQQFAVTVNYFKSFGAGGGPNGSRNPFIDRDFIGIAATYQF